MRILRNYSIGQRYMAYFLLGSLLLQSCYNPAIPPKQVGIVEESKVPSMVLANLEASTLEEEVLSSSIEIEQGPISIEQDSQRENSSKLEVSQVASQAVPTTTHQSSFPKKKVQRLSIRKLVLSSGDELQGQRKLMESKQSSKEKAPLSSRPLKEATKVVETDKSYSTTTHSSAPLASMNESEKEIPLNSSLSSSDESSQETSFSNTLKGIYSQAKSSFTKKFNDFSAFLTQEIKEVSALVNSPTVFQINFGEDKAFWRAHYQSDMEDLKTTSCPSLAAQQELMEKQDLVWNGLLSPYEYQAGLQELASSWPAALLQTIKDEWERRLGNQPALLERFLLDDLRTCFQENLQSTWSIDTFQGILSFYGQRMNALDYKAQLVYVREAVIKNKQRNVLTLGEHKELISLLNAAIERSSKLERRRLKEERRRFYAEAKELPFLFADEEVSPLGIWNDVAEVNQDKELKAEQETHTKGSSSIYELSPSSLLKSLGKGLMRGIDFAVKHPVEAVVMGLSMQVAAAAAMNTFTIPKGSQKTNRQEGANENKADKPVSHQSLFKRALGDEFQINQNTAGNLQYPSLTSLANGNAFVTWHGDQTRNFDIYGRVFDPSGTALGSEFLINQNTTCDVIGTSLTSLANGNVFVAWEGYQTGNADIYGRVFDPSGTALGSEFLINQNTTREQSYPSITSLASGNAFVTWKGNQTGDYDIYGRVFDPSGTALGSEFRVNQNTTGWQDYYHSSITSLTNGNVFVAWEGKQTGNSDIYGRVFDPSGTALGSEFPINQVTEWYQWYPSLTSLPNGNAFVTWYGYQTGNSDIYGRVFHPNGTALGSDFPINQVTTGYQWPSSITSLSNGNAFVTWWGDQTGDDDIYGRVFASNGTALSNEFPINQNTMGEQRYPSLTSLPNGNAFVIWEGYQPGNNNIYGRLFAPNGMALSDEFQVSQNTAEWSAFPSVTSLSNGNAFVIWEGYQPGNNNIYGRIFILPVFGITTGGLTVGGSQTSQGEGSSTLEIGIGVGLGGGALLTFGSIAAWKYYSYKRNKQSASQSGQNRDLELELETMPLLNPLLPRQALRLSLLNSPVFSDQKRDQAFKQLITLQ